jgi:hypothetical protein
VSGARFKTEADLCQAFIAWAGRHHPDLRCLAEWEGWDILVAYPEGFQLGIQAKLRANAKVIRQAAPEGFYGDMRTGPDFRGVLIPERNDWAEVAEQLGLVPFYSGLEEYDWQAKRKVGWDFIPSLRPGHQTVDVLFSDWVDWNPETRHELPPVASTGSVAGSSAPVTLTPWKLRALDVLAVLAVESEIQPARMRALGVDPRRWTQNHWLLPTEKRGFWFRGPKCPAFDEQHPEAYAAALEAARKRA